MPIQVNARLPDEDWERIVEALPGESNAERISQLVRQHIALLDARRSLPEALDLIERLLAPTLQRLREQGLRGSGSELAELLAKTVAEMAAVLLSQAEGLRSSPERTLPELESMLVQRWSRTTVQLLRTSALEPAALRHPGVSSQELRRIFEQVALLQQATRTQSTAPASGGLHDGAGAPVGGLPNQLVQSLLQYRLQVPLVDKMLSELGLSLENGQLIPSDLGSSPRPGSPPPRG